MSKKKWGAEEFRVELAGASADGVTLSQPLHVVLGEAADVSSFFAEHWKSVEDEGTVIRAGLDRAGKKLRASTGQEIRGLIDLVQAAQTKILLSTEAKGGQDTIERGRYVVRELDATLAFHFDDGTEDDKDAQLTQVRATHAGTPDSVDAMSSELADYGGLAGKYKAELAAIPDFDVTLIAEAMTLSSELRDRPATGPKGSEKTESAKALRNKYLSLLLQRVSLVRAAARFIYRNDPATMKKVSSSYDRRRRTSAKKAEPTPAPQA